MNASLEPTGYFTLKQVRLTPTWAPHTYLQLPRCGPRVWGGWLGLLLEAWTLGSKSCTRAKIAVNWVDIEVKPWLQKVQLPSLHSH